MEYFALLILLFYIKASLVYSILLSKLDLFITFHELSHLPHLLLCLLLLLHQFLPQFFRQICKEVVAVLLHLMRSDVLSNSANLNFLLRWKVEAIYHIWFFLWQIYYFWIGRSKLQSSCLYRVAQ